MKGNKKTTKRDGKNKEMWDIMRNFFACFASLNLYHRGNSVSKKNKFVLNYVVAIYNQLFSNVEIQIELLPIYYQYSFLFRLNFNCRIAFIFYIQQKLFMRYNICNLINKKDCKTTFFGVKLTHASPCKYIVQENKFLGKCRAHFALNRHCG